MIKDKWDKEYILHSARKTKFTRKKANAIYTGYEWKVTFDEVIWNTHCPILGLELDYFAETASENSPSLDRIDNNKGYIKDNVHVISWRANRIKNNGTAEEHRLIADYLDSLSMHSVASQP